MLRQTKLSKVEIIWQGVIFWAVTFSAIETPFSFAFATKIQTWQLWSDAIVSFLFTLDVAYQLKFKKKLIPTDASPFFKILWSLQIVLQVISCIPYDILSSIYGLGAGFQMLRLLRLARVAKIFTLLQNFTIIPHVIRIQFLLVSSIVAIHWIACGWVLIGELPEPARTDYYVKALYWAVTTLTTIGYGDIVPVTNMGRLFTMMIMILGVGVYGVVIGNIARILATQDRYNEMTKEKMNDLANFMKYYKIPERIQHSAFSYQTHVFNKRLTNSDKNIVADLPQALQQEIQTYMNIKLIGAVSAFKNCSLPCLKEVSAKLERKYYSPGQNIIQIGEIGDEMYIVAHGVVDVILSDGNTVASLHEGEFFGEASLLKEVKRNASVRAQSYCDLYKLSKDDFIEITEKYSELRENIESVTYKRGRNKRRPT